MEIALEHSFIPKLAFDFLSECEESSLTQKDLEILYSIFGEQFVLATELLEKCRIIKYTTQKNLRSIFKIVTTKEQYTIFDNINFCHCNVFKLQVLEARKCITCKHVLAVRLGKILGNVIIEEVTGSQLVDFLNEQINFVEVDFEDKNDE